MKPGLLLAAVTLVSAAGSRSAAAATDAGVAGAPTSSNSGADDPGSASGTEPATNPVPVLVPPAADEPVPALVAPSADEPAPTDIGSEGATEVAPTESTTSTPSDTTAQDATPAKPSFEGCRQICEDLPSLGRQSRPPTYGTLGLSPGTPQINTLPGGVTPSFGDASVGAHDWKFRFNGFIMMPLRASIGRRDDPFERQRNTTLKTPPVIPGEEGTFEYTGVVPNPWVQLNFGYGNNNVSATVIIAAKAATNATSYFNPPDQMGVNDAFITVHPENKKGEHRFHLNIGAFTNRYGIMGEYDLGRYGIPVIGQVGGVGATGTGRFGRGKLRGQLEGGVTGTFNKAPLGVAPSGWNDFADANVGSSFAAHAHAGGSYDGRVQFGLHWVTAFSSDDRATTAEIPDGEVHVFGADARLTLRRFGHLSAAFAHTIANDARVVGPVLRVLDTRGGLGLMENYLGLDSGGNGSLDTVGAQYDFSLGNVLRWPEAFEGDGPDLIFSLFGMYTYVRSDDATRNGDDKLKYGAEVGYSALSWLGAAVRFDHVMPDLEDFSQTHVILSPRLIFRSGFNAQDQIVLQYSHYWNGSGVAPYDGYPPRPDPSVTPDNHVVSLSVAMWW